jgi:hypothetical protein
MKKNISKFKVWFQSWMWLIPVLLLAFVLRFYNYTQFPVVGETQDEVAWTYLGSSLLADGVPTSWSYFEAYQENNIYLETLKDLGPLNAPLVRPVLDHPPLFALIPGTAHFIWTQLTHQSWEVFPSASVIRLPMVLLGTLNVLLFAWVATYLLKDKKWVVISTLLYSVWPTIVFASRLVVSENLLITWTLLILGLIWSKLYQKKWGWYVLILSIMAAVLTKVSGLVLPVTILAYGLLSKNKKIIQAGLIGGILGVALFAIYGAVYDWQLFINVFTSQSGRDLGLATLQNRFFLHPAIVDKFYFDGLVLGGLFSSAILIFNHNKTSHKKLALLTLAVILNLLFIAATSGEQTFHGWYDYVLYPLFGLSLGWLLEKICQKENYSLLALIWLLILPLFRWVFKIQDLLPGVDNLVIRGVILIGFLPLGADLLNQPKLAKNFYRLLITSILLASIFVVWKLQMVDYWEVDSFFLYR